ncbi:PARP-domain-containing protein [Aaosphaeria arxii CBS 175.79]|uniref:Poly [ADP-ribose] polymerase n=1 Tax=Aaosphaeria arxii CBS 175.79 TaxID=1450172 RepID=A0A6A5Y2T9_9PLEO|nr:PARP-domain-containing protein [Aaosphaeria arxii CBS 175.79]KAF2019211.1 PARP-domain-containing protein [Aaosphaeria arxii CBS 175.79]
MPPKRKAAAAKLPLAGQTIAISGTFPGQTQASIQLTITTNGGAVDKAVTSDTKVLVSTEADVKKSSTKVKAAEKHGVPIASIDWLNDCVASGKWEDPNDYVISSSTQNATANANGNANGKKRAASTPPAAVPDKKSKTTKAAAPKEEPKFGEGSVLKSKDIVVPIDEGCTLYGYQVYVDDDGVVYDAALNQTNASHNNNKFYRVQLLRHPASLDYKTWTRWGRVGDFGQKAVLGSGSLDDAMSNFEKKFKDKSGLAWSNRAADPKKGKYAYVERSYAPDSDDEEGTGGPAGKDGEDEDDEKPKVAESTLAPEVQSLMQLIFNQQYMNAAMDDLNYDANKMPLGKLSKATINRGFQNLKDLAALLQSGQSNHSDIEDLSNRYYSLIPHNFGRNRPPVLNDNTRLKKEIELLESLADMKEAAELMKKDLKNGETINALDRQFRGLGLNEMSVLDSTSTEFKELADYLMTTRGSTHHVNYQIESIFRIERDGELDRFQKSKFSNIKSDRRLLWHGSRATNFGGILSQGLRIAPPEAPVSGYMFGKGIYLADMSSKSANYCCSYNSGGHALLLLCEAELGDPLYELTNSSYTAGEDAIARGSFSTWGKGTTAPLVWKDGKDIHESLAGVKIPDVRHPPTNTQVPNAYLLYNEYITYDVAQVRLRYLFRVKM